MLGESETVVNRLCVDLLSEQLVSLFNMVCNRFFKLINYSQSFLTFNINDQSRSPRDYHRASLREDTDWSTVIAFFNNWWSQFSIPVEWESWCSFTTQWTSNGGHALYKKIKTTIRVRGKKSRRKAWQYELNEFVVGLKSLQTKKQNIIKIYPALERKSIGTAAVAGREQCGVRKSYHESW